MVTIIKKGASNAAIQRKIKKALKGKKKLSIMDFAGLLKSKIDPLEFQKQMRDEWA
jgi:malic enzyme